MQAFTPAVLRVEHPTAKFTETLGGTVERDAHPARLRFYDRHKGAWLRISFVGWALSVALQSIQQLALIDFSCPSNSTEVSRLGHICIERRTSQVVPLPSSFLTKVYRWLLCLVLDNKQSRDVVVKTPGAQGVCSYTRLPSPSLAARLKVAGCFTPT